MRKPPKVGAIVEVRTSWGNGPVVKGRVVSFDRKGHHGRDVFDYVVIVPAAGYPVGAQHWAYLEQLDV